MKPQKVAIDQHGNRFYFTTIKSLREQLPGRCGKMYIDDKSGKSFHVGYVVGRHWLTIYQQIINEVK